MGASIKRFLLFIILIIEKIQYRNLDLDETDPNKKIINSLDLSGFSVLSDSGYVNMNQLHNTQPYTEYKIKTRNKSLTCADHHILFDKNYKYRSEKVKLFFLALHKLYAKVNYNFINIFSYL